MGLVRNTELMRKEENVFMDKLNPKLIEQIENALDIKFYDWQKDYLLDIPRVLDMRMTGRCTGKTLAYIIKLLFSEDEPLRVYDIEEMKKCSDWWSVTNRINHSEPRYSQWFRGFLIEIHTKLSKKGLQTRPVFRNREEEKQFYYAMNVDKALSLAITCVNNSDLDALEKNEVGARLIGLGQIIDLVRYREFDDSEILDMIDKIIKR